eukprot:711798-Pyramimonas_sp.AAC.1
MGQLATPDRQRITIARVTGFGQLALSRHSQLARAALPDRQRRGYDCLAEVPTAAIRTSALRDLGAQAPARLSSTPRLEADRDAQMEQRRAHR